MSEYIFEENGRARISVSVKAEDSNEGSYNRQFCELFQHGSEERGFYWKIYETTERKYTEFLNDIKFETKEQAAFFCHQFIERSSKIAETAPLPYDVTRYLEERENHLRKEEESTLEDFYRIREERYRLREVAKRNQISSIMFHTQWIDKEKAVNELLTFEVHIKADGKEEYEAVPFISEAALYSLIGKDDARNVLVLINNICNMVAPNIVASI